MKSPTQWTWVWVHSGNWWWTRRPGVLQSMGVTESDMTEQLNWFPLGLIWFDHLAVQVTLKKRPPIFLILGVRGPPWVCMHRKAPWRSEREGPPPHSKWCSLPIGLFSGFHLGWETCTHMWEDPEIHQIWTLHRANQNDSPKETQEKGPIPNGTQTPSLSPLVSIHTYLYSFPPSKHFTCFSTLCLHGNSFLQSHRARVLSLTPGLVVRTRCHHRLDWPQSLAGNWNPAPSHCRLRPPEIKPTVFLWWLVRGILQGAEAHLL